MPLSETSKIGKEEDVVSPPETTPPGESSTTVIQGTIAQSSDSEKSKASKYFQLHGESDVITKFNDFKGKKRKDQQERFIVLYVWAYNTILGKPVPVKQQVIEAMRRIKLHDTNSTTYFQQTANALLIHTDSGFELNTRGLQVVEQFLEEIGDNSVPDGFEYWKGSSRPGQKRHTISKEEDRQVKSWVEMSLDIGQLDIRELKAATNCAMFALWAITKGIDVIKATKPKMAYLYLTQKYTTVSVGSKAFITCLGRGSNKSKFSKNPEGLYYLTPQAEREVESWIKGTEIQQEVEPEVLDDEGDE
ncbi:MAG: hypothetical protein GFH27_549305n132 [Chloroflexi bacterium AL-W]|nr:hypothetical protein [Chloroflexi bacterium AL-N1]NOK69378.1 hypothetical protein [Chloroflexi bacterium AL-N10]NOK76439.1 hypothetical protein [Chloroflexi bacterium AL-N5]NOK83556.1 hypothetical protein [Chloroflexi bacterium AL-W]NOK91216.1 hypothetical protein [Chloroflexi bacterium AL-N15]